MTRIPHLLTFLDLLAIWDFINPLKIEVSADIDCPFCHHPVHHDLGCRYCNCKENKRAKDELGNKVNKVGNWAR